MEAHQRALQHGETLYEQKRSADDLKKQLQAAKAAAEAAAAAKKIENDTAKDSQNDTAKDGQ